MGFLDDHLFYTSISFVRVKNWRLALLYYVAVTLLCVYVVVAIFKDEHYQVSDPVSATSMFKVRGATRATFPKSNRSFVFDSNDLIGDLSHPDSAFLTTSLSLVEGQRMGFCEGNHDDGYCKCSKGGLADCCPKEQPTDNGVKTGRCGANGRCEVEAWCPVPPAHKDTGEYEAHFDIRHWTVFVRWTAHFSRFNLTSVNVHGDNLTEGINVWTVDEICSQTGWDFDFYKRFGGVLTMSVRYDCNLDYGFDTCKPTIGFRREDDPSRATVGHGFNFRYIDRYVEDGAVKRNMYHARGLVMRIVVEGQARKFSFVSLMLALGSGAAIISAAKLLTDFLMQNLLPDGAKYKAAKYRQFDPASDQETNHLLSQGRSDLDRGTSTAVAPH